MKSKVRMYADDTLIQLLIVLMTACIQLQNNLLLHAGKVGKYLANAI